MHFSEALHCRVATRGAIHTFPDPSGIHNNATTEIQSNPSAQSKRAWTDRDPHSCHGQDVRYDLHSTVKDGRDQRTPKNRILLSSHFRSAAGEAPRSHGVAFCSPANGICDCLWRHFANLGDANPILSLPVGEMDEDGLIDANSLSQCAHEIALEPSINK
jgi:hypothetical protein